MKILRLEAIRGFLALFVFLAHFPAKGNFFGFNFIFLATQEAVMGFFLLSGFVIYFAAHKRLHEGFFSYLKKRFVRIYSVLIPLLLLVWLLDNHCKYQPGFTKELIGNLFMLQDFALEKPGVVVPTVFGIFPLWSLSYEWWFYMLFFPIACYVAGERQKHVVGVAGVVAALSYIVLPNIVNRVLLYLPLWWIGVEIARLYCAHPQSVTLKNLRWPMFYVIAAATPLAIRAVWFGTHGGHHSFGLHPWIEPRHLFAGIILLLLGFAWRRLNWFGFAWTVGPAILASGISYALYIAHWPLVVKASYFSFIQNPVLEYVLYIAVLLTFCVFTERVIFKWLRKYAR
ncbi:MAG: acyltransferase family protein [Nibricoccus sp.]